MAIQTLLEALLEYDTYIAPLTLVAVICYVILYSHPTLAIYKQYERFGNAWWMPKMLGRGPQKLFQDGYDKVMIPTDKPFVVKWWSLDNLILPPKYLPDLQRVRSENASFLKNFSDAVNLQYSIGNLYESDRMGDILRKGLNPNLSRLTPLINEEIKLAIDKEIGALEDWKTFKTVELLITISHRVVSRLLAGDELSKREDFIHLSMKFSDSCFVTGLIISQLPFGPFRPFFGWLIAQYHRWTLYRMLKMTEPVIAKRMADARNEKSVPRYDDSIEWAIKLDDPPERDSRTITLEMLHILEAAAGAPGAMMSEMIYQLLVEPHYIQTLIEEIEAAKESSADLNEAMQKLVLMDSFIMETNRMYPVGGVTAARTVMREPMVLHDGTTLPVGTRIGFPCKAIQLDSRNFQDPFQFDGFRFARMNVEEGKDEDGATRYSASTATSTQLSWGYGKHACPGRFYSIKLAKLVFMELLLKYEIRANGKELKEHPPSFEVEGQFLPNMQQKIQLRRKSAQ